MSASTIESVAADAAADTSDFNPEQKRYLEGFVAGMQIARTARDLTARGLSSSPATAETAGASSQAPAVAAPPGPDSAHRKAQDRVLAAGGKLSDPEKFKREQHPFDAYERLKEQAAKVEYVSVQNLSLETWHFASHRARVDSS